MKAPHISTSSSHLPRRTFLRGAGVTLGLPLLECMTPSFLRAAGEAQPPRRMLLIANNLGVLPKFFFPQTPGRGYELSPYLSTLADFRQDFTVFSGLSHPGVTGGHSTDNCFLTAARGAFKSGFRNSISLDQFAAEKLGQVTRFPTLNLGVNIDKGNRSLSWTRDGVLLPAEDSATKLYERMFLQGDQESVARQLHKLESRGSILDTLLEETKRFHRTLAGEDKARLDQYVTSVREVEERLQTSRAWEMRPKPPAPQPAPAGIQDRKLFFEKFDLMLATAQLALESDSTRIVTLMADAFFTPVFKLNEQETSTDSYHGLTHHGQAEDKVKQLQEVDHQQMMLLKKAFHNLAGRKENGRRLLDRTMVLYGSNMGDANIHDNTNLPILLAGGGFRHGQHIVFKRDNNAPLSNLFVSMLRRIGVEMEAFASSTGPVAGLDTE
ncbi:MAG TPA: DUF1552 domain-containing protein [Bryobacteraceae bacterium]|nr:DUF1552 domain-containing protein [Bryobacteraceae bacterium]